MSSISSLIRDMHLVLRKNQGPLHSLVISRRSHPRKGEPGARGLQSPWTTGAGRWPKRGECRAGPAFCPVLGEPRGGRAPTPDFHTSQECGPWWWKEAGPRASRSNRGSRQGQRAGGAPRRVTEPRGRGLGSGRGWSQHPGRGPGGATGAALGPEPGGRLFCSLAGPIAVASTQSLTLGPDLQERTGQP